MFTCITRMKAVNKYGFNANMQVIHHVGSEAAMQTLQKRIEKELDDLGEEKARALISMGGGDTRPATVGDAPVFVTISFEVLGPGHAHEAMHQSLMTINNMNIARRRITDGMFSMGDANINVVVPAAPDQSNSGSSSAQSSGPQVQAGSRRQ